jgi:hypothetical protein
VCLSFAQVNNRPLFLPFPDLIMSFFVPKCTIRLQVLKLGFTLVAADVSWQAYVGAYYFNVSRSARLTKQFIKSSFPLRVVRESVRRASVSLLVLCTYVTCSISHDVKVNFEASARYNCTKKRGGVFRRRSILLKLMFDERLEKIR